MSVTKCSRAPCSSYGFWPHISDRQSRRPPHAAQGLGPKPPPPHERCCHTQPLPLIAHAATLSIKCKKIAQPTSTGRAVLQQNVHIPSQHAMRLFQHKLVPTQTQTTAGSCTAALQPMARARPQSIVTSWCGLSCSSDLGTWARARAQA